MNPISILKSLELKLIEKPIGVCHGVKWFYMNLLCFCNPSGGSNPAGYQPFSKMYNSVNYYTWVFIFLYGEKLQTWDSCQNACVIFTIMYVFRLCHLLILHLLIYVKMAIEMCIKMIAVLLHYLWSGILIRRDLTDSCSLSYLWIWEVEKSWFWIDLNCSRPVVIDQDIVNGAFITFESSVDSVGIVITKLFYSECLSNVLMLACQIVYCNWF